MKEEVSDSHLVVRKESGTVFLVEKQSSIIERPLEISSISDSKKKPIFIKKLYDN